MTNHYKVHIVKNNVSVKLTYRDGKFLRLEKLTGSLEAQQLRQIGLIIPSKESLILAYSVEYDKRVTYKKIEKKQSYFSKYTDEWFSFYTTHVGVPPRFNGTEGNHLKKIKGYLLSIEQDEEAGLNMWRVILQNWNQLDDFYKNNPDLKFINSQINKIINNVKRISEKGKNSANVSADYIDRISKDLQS